MSEQAPDARRSIQVVRRHKILIGSVTILGLLGGAAYSVVRPATLTSTALVVLPQAGPNTLAPGATGPDAYMQTQIFMVRSDPVLSGALAHISPAISVQALRSAVQVKSPTPNILSVSATGTSAAQAEGRANAVAASYVAYITSPHNAYGAVSAHVLDEATSATGQTIIRRVIYGVLGLVLGALLGILVAFAISRANKRLFQRDEIANSIGIPVLASFPVGHPADAAGWARLLSGYQPGDLYGWRLRHALQQLGMAGFAAGNAGGGGTSLTVVSLASDPRALALGPQLAAYAASLGIPTALVIGTHKDTTAVATLRTACAGSVAESSSSSRPLRLAVAHDGRLTVQPGVVLTVVPVVVDGESPQLTGSTSTTATIVGVSAGAATAEQLARVATSIAADGRLVAGILVADPEPTDRTTGRIPQPLRPPQHRSSVRAEDQVTEARR